MIDLQISARQVMARARDVLGMAVSKFARYTRPSVGAWVQADGCWSLYDDRGVCVAHISCLFAWDGIQRYHWYATRPYRSPARNQERTLEEAKKAVSAVLSTWADIGSVS